MWRWLLGKHLGIKGIAQKNHSGDDKAGDRWCLSPSPPWILPTVNWHTTETPSLDLEQSDANKHNTNIPSTNCVYIFKYTIDSFS